MDLTDQVHTPEIFRLWSGIMTIAAVLERKCWTETDVEPLRPNQFIILTGLPASGKGNALRLARNLLGTISGIGEVFLGPDNPTSASFMDEVAKTEKPAINGMGVLTYSALTVISRELASFMAKYEIQFAANLADLYDNPPTFVAPRRVAKSVTLSAPTINIMAAATPDTLLDTIPEAAWGQGLTSRMIFIYGVGRKSYRDPFKRRKDSDFSHLALKLKEYFHELHGAFIWDVDAQDAQRFWYNDLQQAPVPDYGRLLNYAGRRNEHLMKLAMISAVSAGNGICVTLKDFERAQSWLFAAERVMPDVFRAMSRTTDDQLLQDTHYWMRTTWGNLTPHEKNLGLPERDVWLFLSEKVPHEKIKTIIDTLHKSGRVRKAALGGHWLPNPIDFRKEQNHD